MIVRRRTPWTLAAVLIATLSSAAGAEQTWTSEPVSLDIQPQPLGQALNAFAAQTGLQVAGLSDSWQGLSAPRVVGTFPVQSALNQLLANTSLDYQLIDDARTVAIHAKSTAANTAATIDEESQVIVTGSHIRGAGSAGSPVLVIGREEIEQSGHARMEDLFETLPQNFSGSSSEDSTKGVGYNPNRATGVDLRGLGSGTTLVLVNGHRQPGGDLYGTLTDISSIPSSAVERVEILTDGASAVYGSDAIGGVVNFILRKDYEGAETRMRYGSLDGNADELQFSQLFGTRWSSGNALLGYQYLERDPLLAEDIPYLATKGDMRKYGGTDLRTALSHPGVIVDASGRPTYAIPRGQDGVDLTASDLIPLNGVLPADYPLDYNEDRWYLAQEKLHTVFLSASQNLTDSLELFAEGRWARRKVENIAGGQVSTLSVPNTNAYYVNPTGGTGAVRVAYNFHDDGLLARHVGQVDVHSESVGLKARVQDWQIVASGSYSEEKNEYLFLGSFNQQALNAALASNDPARALNVFGDSANSAAVINSFRATDLNTGRTETWGGGIVADGPLVNLFEREVRLAVGADHRSESLDFVRDLRREYPTDTSADRAASGDREINAAFAELAIPLVPRERSLPGIQQMELSLAGRYEDYSDFGHTFNPKVGLGWTLIDSLHLRGTWGSAFKAPKLVEIAPGYTNNLRSLREASLNNPTVPGTTWRVLINNGPNPDLHEETADIWTAGFDFAPSSIDGLKVSATYFDISYSDKISVINILDTMRSPEGYAAYAPYITPNPSAAEVQALCGQFIGSCTGAAIGAIVNVGLANLSKVYVSGVDLDVSETLDTDVGTFMFGVGGSRLSRYDQVVVSGTPEFNILDTTGNPLALRLRGKFTWSFNGWRTGVFVNYTGSYDNPGGLPAKMDAWTTFDLNLSYEVSSTAEWLNGSRLSFSVNNVTDELPPFMNVDVGYDTANGDLTGRKLSLMLIKEW